MKTKIKENNNSSPFFGVLQIINKHFWKAFVGPFFAFLYPIVFVIVLGTIFSYEMILAGSISIGPLAIACVALPTAIFEFKKSTLLKRIGTTNIKPLSFLAYTATYYFIIMILSGLWTAIVSLIVFGSRYWETGRELYNINQTLGSEKLLVTVAINSLKTIFERIHWLSYIYSFIVLTLVSVAVGLFLVSISKSILMIQAIGSSLLIFTMFLTGQVLPLAQIANVESMWWLSYLTPFKSPIVQNTMAFQSNAELTRNYMLNDVKVTAENSVYSIHDLKNYINGVMNYINKMQEAQKTNNLMQQMWLVNNQSIFFSIPQKITENVDIKFTPYSIFNVFQQYYAVDGLSSYKPVILSYDEIFNLVKTTNIKDSDMNLGQIINQFTEATKQNLMSGFNNSFIQLNDGSIGAKSLIKIGSVTENIVNFVLPMVWITILVSASAKSFTWNVR
ncbi:hypothetical protein [Mycoplasma phocoenae]|uniref:ABC transporter permease n=1 Tax=Mycoplasma phocoenae TaxID=754517 RepID=A0A858U6J8_9MOLU|nr:hypothetical protein [Mycoplasma phocoenae]QJG66853.1 ABC transporter permease [Mycoplasma phocoenae]